MFDRLKSWFNGRSPAPASLAENVVKHDPFDRQDFEDVLAKMGAFRKAGDRLAEASPTGRRLLEDLYFSLCRVRPEVIDDEEVRPTYQRNRQILAEAMGLPDWHRLHAETKGDPWFAGMAATALVPNLVELLNRTADQQEMADTLDATMGDLAAVQQARDEIEEALAALEPGDQADEAQASLDDLTSTIDDLSAKADGEATRLDHMTSLSSLDVSSAMHSALGDAADQVSDEKAVCALWGTDAGQLQRMSADQHVKLAHRLDSEKLREVAKLYGALKYDVQGARAAKSRYTRDEVYAIEQGNDLSRVLPTELVKLSHPLRRLEFYRGFAEGTLQQYQLEGVEKQSQGGIILLEDGSASMEGQRELYAKATSLHLMDIARLEERSFTAVMFGGPGQYRTFRFETAADYTTDRMIEWAETFIDSGGTCFRTPLDEALRLLTEEFDATGAVTGDVVLLTDGEASVTPDWLNHFKGEQKRLEFTVYGVQVGGGWGRYELGLEAIADGGISTVSDLFTAKDTRSIYARV